MDPDGPVSLKWHQFSTNLGTSSTMLRESNILTDITFIVEEKQVGAHKLILASCSPLFLSLLHPSSHPHPMVYLRGVSYRDLTSLLDFMYKGEVSVEQRYLESFLNTAEELKVKGLSENGSVPDDSKAVGELEEVGNDTKNTANDVFHGNVETPRRVESKPGKDCVKDIEEMEGETPLSCDPNLDEDQHFEMNNSASSNLASLKSGSNLATRAITVKHTPAKAKRKSLTEAGKTCLEKREIKSAVEESQSLSAKRSSLYGKKLTEEWKTESNKKSQSSRKPTVKNVKKQTIDSSSSDNTKGGKRKISKDDLACNKLKQQRRIKNSVLKAGAESESGAVEIPGVSDKQKAISARLEFAIEATKEEIKKLEGVENEDDLPCIADATDGTIAEVEKVLKLSQEVLSGFDYVDSADYQEDPPYIMDNDVSDPSSGNVSQIIQSPVLSPNLRSDKSNSISSEVCESSSENILTPVKKMAIISLMLVKGNSNSSPWKCSICKKLFKSKSSAEEHIELEHVEGKLQ